MSDDNSSSTIELNRRRVLGALGTIGVASAGAGAGTFALFSDTEESSGNSVQAGTLDLTGDGPVTTVFDASNVSPGESGGGIQELRNEGSIGGEIDISVGDATVTQEEPTEADDDVGGNTRTFTAYYDDGGNDVTPVFGSPAETSVTWENGNGNMIVETDVPFEIDEGNPAAAKVVSYVFARPDLESAVNILYNPGKNTGADFNFTSGDDGWAYKSYSDTNPFNGLGWEDNEEADIGTPSWASASFDYDSGVHSLTIDKANAPFLNNGEFVFGSRLEQGGGYAGLSSTMSVTPNFGFNPSSLIPISFGQGVSRDIADLLDVTLTLADENSGGSPDGDSLAVSGKLAHVAGRDYLNNEDGGDAYMTGSRSGSSWNLPSNQSDFLYFNWELSPNVGNAAQGDDVEVDVTIELNQEDSQ